MKKTYFCFEPGEHHPAFCVVEKHIDVVGRLKPKEIFTYHVHALESLPADMAYLDMREKIKMRMQKYTMGGNRFILGYTYIKEETARFFERTTLKPAKITVTGEEKSRKEGFMFYVPYSELLNCVERLREEEALFFTEQVTEHEFIKDDDCDLTLNMALWFASQDTEQRIGKNTLGL